MRRLFILGILAATLVACNKDVHKMEIVRDCTGVYLRAKNGQDFKVCNDGLLESYTTGTKIKVSYDNLEQCFGLIEPITCELLHIHEGVIEVTEIH